MQQGVQFLFAKSHSLIQLRLSKSHKKFVAWSPGRIRGCDRLFLQLKESSHLRNVVRRVIRKDSGSIKGTVRFRKIHPTLRFQVIRSYSRHPNSNNMTRWISTLQCRYKVHVKIIDFCNYLHLQASAKWPRKSNEQKCNFRLVPGMKPSNMSCLQSSFEVSLCSHHSLVITVIS